MSGNIVKLVIESVGRGSGFSSAVKDIDAMRKNLGFASGAAKMFGKAIGGLGGIVGGSVGALLRGNVWQLGAIAAGKLVSVIKDHNQLMKDASLAARGLSREYMTLEFAHAQYQKRVEGWRKAKEAADQAEKDAAEARKKEAEAAKSVEKERLSFEQKYYELEKQIAAEISDRESMGEDELTVLKKKFELVRKIADIDVAQARRNLDSARKTGDGSAVSIAENELKLAQERQKTAYKRSSQLVTEFSKAQDKKLADAAAEREQKEKEKREEELSRKRIELREKEDRIREEGEKAILNLEKEIEQTRERADRLEANARKARGVGFGAWSRGERDASRIAREEQSAQEKREKQVDSELERLEKTNPRTRTKWQKERIKRLREWKADQDPNNNPELKKLKDLQDKRDKIQNDMLTELKEIAKQLKAATEI